MSIMTGPEAGERPRRGRPRTAAQMDKVRAMKTGRTPPPARFRHRDLKYAIKAARDAGLDMDKTGFKVDKNGTISVVPLASGESPADTKGANEWDEVLRKRGE